MIRRAAAQVHYLSDFLATRLALVFGFDLTIWVFFIVPLIAEFFPPTVQAKVFYYASGWVQLFALPLMVYVSNKIERSSAAQDTRNAEILRDVRQMLADHVEEVRRLVPPPAPPPPE